MDIKFEEKINIFNDMLDNEVKLENLHNELLDTYILINEMVGILYEEHYYRNRELRDHDCIHIIRTKLREPVNMDNIKNTIKDRYELLLECSSIYSYFSCFTDEDYNNELNNKF